MKRPRTRPEPVSQVRPERTSGGPDETIRSFIAVELAPKLKQELEAQARRLASLVGGGARAIRADAMHLTVRFLGDVQASRLERLGEELARVCGPVSPMDLTVCGVGAFPNLDRPRVIWAGFEKPPEALSRLKLAIDRVADEFASPDDRPFHPHLTLVRLRSPRRVPTLRGETELLSRHALGTIRLRQVVLMQSELRASGAVYTPLRQLPLEGAGA